jgi:ABC-type nitrate/sulfonate/bicarbonate transport system ATPase subunit
MVATNRFPRKLLVAPNELRLEYFINLTIGHPLLLQAHDDLLRAIRQPFSNILVFVYGPTGVGKTTLWRKIQKHLTEELLPLLEQDSTRLPFVGIDLASPDYGIFNWKDFYKRFLLAMDEPLIEHKAKPEIPTMTAEGRLHIKIGPRSGPAELRLVTERVLLHRRPVVILIDEAQHLAKIASGRKLQDQLDALKSLSNQTGIIIVLLGTYELLVFRNLSAQLSRRSIDIHFQRYHFDREEDSNAFQSVLNTFQHHLPLREEPNLLAHWEYFYERSIGCVGVLKEWLTRALNEALDDGGKRLTQKHWARYALSVAQCEKMLSDAKEGEMRLLESDEAHRRLRASLGIEAEISSRVSEKETHLSDDNVSISNKPKPRRRPGRRYPKRDPTGK